jgi:hypothetical protein
VKDIDGFESYVITQERNLHNKIAHLPAGWSPVTNGSCTLNKFERADNAWEKVDTYELYTVDIRCNHDLPNGGIAEIVLPA